MIIAGVLICVCMISCLLMVFRYPCHISRNSYVNIYDGMRRRDVTDGRENFFGEEIRGQPDPPAEDCLPDARLAARGRRAVQEAWPRLSRSETTEIENLGGWLTTVVARVCLDMLRSRESRREEALDGGVPEPTVSRARRRVRGVTTG